jgi:predicted phage terminase large subunit-like protein
MTVQTDRALFNALMRRNPEVFLQKVFQVVCPGQQFVPGWYISAILYQLMRVYRGEIKRLIIEMAPRSLKSIMTSVAFPAYVHGLDPTKKFVCYSYSGDLAAKHSNDYRFVIKHPFYKEAFPRTQISRHKDTESEIELTARGGRLATSVGGTLTGRGGDFIIIDDPLKASDALSDAKRNDANEWFRSTTLSRLDDPRTGAIIIVMQRVHMDDLSGFVQRHSDGWTVLSLPAIAESQEIVKLLGGEEHVRQPGEALAPERASIEYLQDLRRQLGSDLFSAQYQQAPIPPSGLMIKKGWIRRYTEYPSSDRGRFILQSWDTAAKGGPDNDWSVCTTWLMTDDCQWYLLDVWRQQVDYPTLKDKVEELAKHWGANLVLVEESGTAIGLLQELGYRVPGITGIKPDKDKITRMSLATPIFRAGQVHFPESAAWLPELEAELFAFPHGRHDDQVDSISQAINNGSNSDLQVWRKLAVADFTQLPQRPYPQSYPGHVF